MVPDTEETLPETPVREDTRFGLLRRPSPSAGREVRLTEAAAGDGGQSVARPPGLRILQAEEVPPLHSPAVSKRTPENLGFASTSSTSIHDTQPRFVSVPEYTGSKS